MNEKIRQKWDIWFQDEASCQLDTQSENWLAHYSSLFGTFKDLQVLDLGCGRGFDSAYLKDLGFRVISADFSRYALLTSNRIVPSGQFVEIDLHNRLPFHDGSFGLIVANLSLHYFSSSDTRKIIADLSRTLDEEGWLIARVNSVKDPSYLSVCGDENLKIEENYYFYQEIPRRYFSAESIRNFFSDSWTLASLEEKTLMRYGKPKVLWEFHAQKTSPINLR